VFPLRTRKNALAETPVASRLLEYPEKAKVIGNKGELAASAADSPTDHAGMEATRRFGRALYDAVVNLGRTPEY